MKKRKALSPADRIAYGQQKPIGTRGVCRTRAEILALVARAENVYDVRKRDPRTGALEVIELPKKRSA